jgi:hypothetical protein
VTQQQVTVGRCTIAAAGLWIASFGLLAYLTLAGPHMVAATWAVVISAGAATMTVRCFLIQQAESMRNAYEIGRDVRDLGIVRMRQPSSN